MRLHISKRYLPPMQPLPTRPVEKDVPPKPDPWTNRKPPGIKTPPKEKQQ